MLGRVTDEGTAEEDGDPPATYNSSKDVDCQTKAAGNEDAVKKDEKREFCECQRCGL